ncbi:MAG: hypothetical protein VYD19_07745 [Myxococcota bacterium]|nr:hypothetical protein [Myxococcota bacterium]
MSLPPKPPYPPPKRPRSTWETVKEAPSETVSDLETTTRVMDRLDQAKLEGGSGVDPLDDGDATRVAAASMMRAVLTQGREGTAPQSPQQRSEATEVAQLMIQPALSSLDTDQDAETRALPTSLWQKLGETERSVREQRNPPAPPRASERQGLQERRVVPPSLPKQRRSEREVIPPAHPRSNERQTLQEQRVTPPVLPKAAERETLQSQRVIPPILPKAAERETLQELPVAPPPLPESKNEKTQVAPLQSRIKLPMDNFARDERTRSAVTRDELSRSSGSRRLYPGEQRGREQNATASDQRLESARLSPRTKLPSTLPATSLPPARPRGEQAEREYTMIHRESAGLDGLLSQAVDQAKEPAEGKRTVVTEGGTVKRGLGASIHTRGAMLSVVSIMALLSLLVLRLLLAPVSSSDEAESLTHGREEERRSTEQLQLPERDWQTRGNRFFDLLRTAPPKEGLPALVVDHDHILLNGDETPLLRLEEGAVLQEHLNAPDEELSIPSLVRALSARAVEGSASLPLLMHTAPSTLLLIQLLGSARGAGYQSLSLFIKNQERLYALPLGAMETRPVERSRLELRVGQEWLFITARGESGSAIESPLSLSRSELAQPTAESLELIDAICTRNILNQAWVYLAPTEDGTVVIDALAFLYRARPASEGFEVIPSFL